MRTYFLLVMFFLGMANMASAQTVNGDYAYQTQMSDPIEPLNRIFWDFNYLFLDAYIYKPVATSYVNWVPDIGRSAINNFALNFNEPSTMVNSLLLLEFTHAAKALYRFSLNSTVGLLGLIDLAEKTGVPYRRETFSNVLGHWYVPHGPYLMLPFLGPNSTRNLVGSIVDSLYFPMSYLNVWQSVGILGLNGLELRASLLGQEALLEQSLDPYVFAKEAYIQYEAFKFYKDSELINKLIEQQRSDNEEEENFDSFLDEID